MEDVRIIERLFDRDEGALDELSLKYRNLYMHILRGLLRDEGEAEECADDLLFAVWNSIPPQRPQSLAAFLTVLARRIGIDRLRSRNRLKRGNGLTVALDELSDCLPDEAANDKDIELGRVLSDFCRALDPETRILFLRRYLYTESVESLALRFRMSPNAVSVKLYRARKKLKKRLEQEEIL